MAITVGRFEMPNRLIKDENVSNQTYAKFIAEPFERGYGYTIGNSLRRVLLSSLEGAAITSIKIDGVSHEFSIIDGIVEDVAEIILNLKRVLFITHTRDTKKGLLKIDKKGVLTAKEIMVDNTIEIVNPDHVIATVTGADVHLTIELEISIGRGYNSAEQNKTDDQSLGVIPIDSIFSPVKAVKYTVENTRVGKITDYDKLILEIWTDGRISPHEALRQSSSILQRHLDIFVDYDDHYVEFEQQTVIEEKETDKLTKLLNIPISEIELSVRSANCILGAQIKTIRDLVTKSEPEMLKYKNFGKKSLNEIKAILQGMGLSLGMKLEGVLGLSEKNIKKEEE